MKQESPCFSCGECQVCKKIRHSSISHPKCHSKGSSKGIKDEVYKCEHHRQNPQNTRQNSIGNCTKQNILKCEHQKNKEFEVPQHEHPSTTESDVHSSDKFDTECTNNDIKSWGHLDKNASDFTKVGENPDVRKCGKVMFANVDPNNTNIYNNNTKSLSHVRARD